MISKKTTSLTIKIIVGFFFIISGILKLISIDSFEVYVFGLEVFPLNLSFLIARIIISLEILLGTFLIIGFYKKTTYWLTQGLLIGFCFFLLYLIIKQSTEHCHCMGDAIVLSHPMSILKNITLITLLWLSYRKTSNKQLEFQKWAAPIIILVTLAIPLIVSPPDSFQFKKYAKYASYNEEKLNSFFSKGTIDTNKKVVCFLGASCSYCKMAAKKINTVAKKTNNYNIISYVFWGSNEYINLFFEETKTHKFNLQNLDANTFLKITDGKMPLILLVENGKVKNKYGYRDFNDKEIINFINSK